MQKGDRWNMKKPHPDSARTKMTAVETATVYIRDKIIMNEFPAGTQLTEVQLAEMCGASRGSIRSALQELESEGLLVSHSNGRKEVTGINRSYVEDLYAMRQILEKNAIDIILSRHYESEYEYIHHVIAPFSELVASNYKDPQWRAKEDMYFHRLLIHASGNRVLEQCWKVVGPVIWHMQSLNAMYGGQVEDYESHVNAQHNKIVKMLRERDPALRDNIWAHINNARIATIDILTQKNCI